MADVEGVPGKRPTDYIGLEQSARKSLADPAFNAGIVTDSRRGTKVMEKRTIEVNAHSQKTDGMHISDYNVTGSRQLDNGLITQALIPGKKEKEVREVSFNLESGLIEYGRREGFEAAALETVGTRSMRLLEELTGGLLGGLAVSAQLVNVLICIFMILWGPGIIIGILAR